MGLYSRPRTLSGYGLAGFLDDVRAWRADYTSRHPDPGPVYERAAWLADLEAAEAAWVRAYPPVHHPSADELVQPGPGGRPQGSAALTAADRDYWHWRYTLDSIWRESTGRERTGNYPTYNPDQRAQAEAVAALYDASIAWDKAHGADTSAAQAEADRRAQEEDARRAAAEAERQRQRDLEAAREAQAEKLRREREAEAAQARKEADAAAARAAAEQAKRDAEDARRRAQAEADAEARAAAERAAAEREREAEEAEARARAAEHDADRGTPPATDGGGGGGGGTAPSFDLESATGSPWIVYGAAALAAVLLLRRSR